MPASMRGLNAPFLSPENQAIYDRVYSLAVKEFLAGWPMSDELSASHAISRHDSGDACDCEECTR